MGGRKRSQIFVPYCGAATEGGRQCYILPPKGHPRRGCTGGSCHHELVLLATGSSVWRFLTSVCNWHGVWGLCLLALVSASAFGLLPLVTHCMLPKMEARTCWLEAQFPLVPLQVEFSRKVSRPPRTCHMCIGH